LKFFEALLKELGGQAVGRGALFGKHYVRL